MKVDLETSNSLADAALPAPSGPVPAGETWLEGDFLVVGYQAPSNMPYCVLLARELRWGLEFLGTATLDLCEVDRGRLIRQLADLASDYPHVEIEGLAAEWVRPFLRVRSRYRENGAMLRSATVVALAS